MRITNYIIVGLFFTPAYGFIDDDPGLYAEEFSIQTERLGAALDDLGAVVEQAAADGISEQEGKLISLRDDFDDVYVKMSEWEKIPDDFKLCTAGLEESAIAAGESVDALIDYVKNDEKSYVVEAAAKYERAIEAYSRAVDTYPYDLYTGQ